MEYSTVSSRSPQHAVSKCGNSVNSTISGLENTHFTQLISPETLGMAGHESIF